MFKMGLHDPFGHLKHKLWPKERSGVKLAIGVGGVQHIVGKILTRSTTLLQTSSQSKFYMRSYGPPKLRELLESQLWQFRDSHLGVSKQNAIWMWASWRGTKDTIRGKVLASSKSGPW
jgi:hypothetical protein